MTPVPPAREEAPWSESWGQLPDEPDRDYARFVAYLALPDRRQKTASAALGLGETRLKNLRAQWRWMERADAYDKVQAVQLLGVTARLRAEAVLALLTGVLGSADALRDAPDSERDARALQALAAAVRSLTPVTEVSASSSGPAAPDVVELAFRRAQQLRSDAA
ncbi:MAG: hypothetical protein ACTH0H_05740 [Brachybacterium sp.]